MGRVKNRDTKPELAVRSMVHRMGFRFRLHTQELPGNPDIVLPRLHKIIFVHGCFWHGHMKCERAKRPTTRQDFWDKKLNGNIERDKRSHGKLRRMGWKVLVVWECETRSPDKLSKKLRRFLYD
jgi:DNA mismatch endonuclease (patch repair protein)